jgi:predicted transcriptional regulator
MPYRTQVRIVADILRVTMDYDEDRQGVGITTILRKANIPYSRLIKILRVLVKHGLIVEVAGENGNRYFISQKGKEFLEAYSKFEEFAEAYGLRL